MKSTIYSGVILLTVITGFGSLTVTQAALPFSDDFTTAHDYGASGVAGSGWDGILNSGALTSGSSSGGILSWQTATGTQWDNAQSTGAFLYEQVTGDFSATVRVISAANGSFANAGLLALDPTSSLPSNGDWMYLESHFNDNNVFFSSVNGVVPGSGNPSLSPKGGYLRLDRTGTTFTSYSKVNLGDSWRLIGSVDRGASIPGSIYLGLTAASYGGAPTLAQFSGFSVVPEPTSALLLASGLGMMALRRRR